MQEGIDAAAALVAIADGGVAECAVWVAEGMYLPTADPTGETDPSDPRTKTIQLKSNVALYGGFGGTETYLLERDIAAYPAILSGDLGAVGDAFDNAYQVVTGAESATIDGFTITGGNADGDGYSDGGGMNVRSDDQLVANCTFSKNSAANGGGGIFNSGGLTIVRSVFSENTAAAGGGVYNYCVLDVIGCTFAGNTASGSGGGLENPWEATGTVVNSLFTDNSAGTGGGIFIGHWSGLTVVGSTVTGNSAVTGGGIRNDDDMSSLTDSIVWGNTATSGAQISSEWDCPFEVSFSAIEGGCDAIDNVSCGAGNIDEDPLFADAAGGDLSLSAGSPCIDAGDNALLPADVADLDGDLDTDEPLPLDLEGNPRVADGDGDTVATVDMGAYEVQP